MVVMVGGNHVGADALARQRRGEGSRQPDRLQRLDAYIEATERVQALVRERNVDVFISNHASYDGAVDKLAQMAGKPDRGGAPHPFVLGQDKVVRALTVMNECARATREVWAR